MTSIPLVILGLDGADPDLIKRWAAEGFLPNIASVMNAGWYANTTGTELLVEHGIWLSIMSGISRTNHGYHYFRQLKKNSYELENVTGIDLNVQPFWSLLSGSDKRIAVMDVPDTRPIPGLNGYQLTDWAVHDPLMPAASEPSDLLRKVRSIFGPQINIHENPNCTDTDQQLYEQLFARISRKGNLCRRLLDHGPFDLFVAVFAECHTGGHQFWQYLQNGPVAAQAEHLTNAIRSIYAEIDRELGLILEQVGKCNVFIISSAGIQTQYPTGGLMEDFCRKLGYQAAVETAGEPQKQTRRNPVSVLRSLIPEQWRIAISRHFPRAMKEKLVSDQFVAQTDWEKTTAFCTPSSHTSFIFVNLKGRQPKGTVSPGAEYERVLVQLESDLSQVVDPATGQSPFSNVVRSSGSNGGRPHETLPDLIVTWRSSQAFQSYLEHPKGRITQGVPIYFRANDHTHEGFVAASGPAIPKSTTSSAVDILTLAKLFVSTMNQSERAEITFSTAAGAYPAGSGGAKI